jgi:hypothetical protein
MQARLASIGIQSEYGGRHSNHATEMALTSFPDGSYLELIAIQPDADAKAVAAHGWSPQMQGDAGPCAWALRATRLDKELKPERGGRQRPDGVRLDWETANVGSKPSGEFFPFLIHDFSPRELRAFPSEKPTTQDFSGVARVVIAVRDLAAPVARYRKAFGLPAPVERVDSEFGAKFAGFENSPVVLAAPLSTWLTARLDEFGEGPCAFVLRSKSKPSGMAISWFDVAKLGWRLGFEAP